MRKSFHWIVIVIIIPLIVGGIVLVTTNNIKNEIPTEFTNQMEVQPTTEISDSKSVEVNDSAAYESPKLEDLAPEKIGNLTRIGFYTSGPTTALYKGQEIMEVEYSYSIDTTNMFPPPVLTFFTFESSLFPNFFISNDDEFLKPTKLDAYIFVEGICGVRGEAVIEINGFSLLLAEIGGLSTAHRIKVLSFKQPKNFDKCYKS